MSRRRTVLLVLALVAAVQGARAQDPTGGPVAPVPAVPPASEATPDGAPVPAGSVPGTTPTGPPTRVEADAAASITMRAQAAGAFLRGQFALSQNLPEEAAPALLQALADDPTNPLLQQQAFVACLLAGRPEAATLARDLPTSAVALLLLGDRAAASGDWAEAQRRFAALPQQPLTEVLRPLTLAWAQQGAGNTDAALALLEPLLERPQAPGIFALHAAAIADLAGRTGEAARLYRTAQAQFAGLNLRLARLLASFEARHGRTAEAEATLRALVAQQPQLGIAQSGLLADMAQPVLRRATDGLAEAYFALAATLRQQNADGFAQVLLRLTLDLRPDFPAARLLMADVLETQGRLQAALAELRAVPDADALAPLARLREAQLDARSDQTEAAVRLLEGLAQAHPDSPVPLALLAGVQSRGKHYNQAAAALGRAIARVPHPGPADWELFYQRGVALDLAHHWPQAQADLERALQLSPDQPQVLNYLGYSWADRGRNLGRARQMLERAVAAQPNNGAIVDSLGWVLLRLGDVGGAVRWLERAVELEPTDPTLNGHLGDAYWAAGRRTEAADQWRVALSLNPDPPERERIEARLHGADASAQGAAQTAVGRQKASATPASSADAQGTSAAARP